MAIAVPAHKIAYMALPKAGCSTVKRMLALIDPDVDLPPRETWTADTWHAIYPTARFRPHRWDGFQDYWRFAVVRDPVKRLLSVYTNRVVQLGDLHNSRRLRRPEFSHLSRDPDPDFFFLHLDAYYEASSVIKHHVLPCELFIGPKPFRYDRVFKTEQIGELAEELGRRSGKSVDISRENSSEMRLDLDDLQPRTIDAIRPLLEREYAHLDAYYANPLT
ncbi:sulfotransferase family 2 domain-containing protein [Primorskyibacter sp. S187A]|uniref:sulfotransferase family 2 domain-containing protein n=1 Tax=Primorskyibacter sp. S187A TaxID=3415130 RepID=UPI003C7B18F2